MNRGRIIKTTGSWHIIKYGTTLIPCKVKGKFRIDDIRTTNPVAVGDIVKYDIMEDGKTGLIKEIEPRKNYIIRKSSKLSKESHLLASNVDQAMLMVTLIRPQTTFEFIDRFLVTSEAYHIPSMLLINKIDLYQDDQLKEMLKKLKEIYEPAGYQCFEISVEKGIGLNLISQLLKNKFTVLAGNSGVGKSSLINKLNPLINVKTADVSEYHQTGKHATTYPVMYEVENESFVIDTPGIKGFGLIDFNPREIGYFFPEIFTLSKYCRFYNCTHTHEPGCAVREAVKTGKLSESRYRSYFKIFTDKNTKYRNKL